MIDRTQAAVEILHSFNYIEAIWNIVFFTLTGRGNMYRISIETHFDSAHLLNGYPGACGRLHGHRWRIQVEVETGQLDPIGISVDFKELSALTDSILERFDHQYLNDVPPFDKVNPTAENISRYLFEELARLLPSGVRMGRVTVWESDKYAVSYAPEPASGA